MRIVLWHGYLLGGTGSNVYNAALAEALVRAGHEVHLLCQDRAPFDQRWVDAAGDWDGGALEVRTPRSPKSIQSLYAGLRALAFCSARSTRPARISARKNSSGVMGSATAGSPGLAGGAGSVTPAILVPPPGLTI